MDFALANQLEGGGWSAMSTPGFAPRGRAPGAAGAPGDLMDTCFALLFLKKSHIAVATPSGKSRPRPGEPREKE